MDGHGWRVSGAQIQLRDPEQVLRRVARRMPLRAPALIGAVLAAGRQYVMDAVDLTPRSTAAAPGGESSRLAADPRLRFAEQIAAVGALRETHAVPQHAVTLIHCRLGRVVWLAEDLRWSELLRQIATTTGVLLADQLLVTEHGWRARYSHAAGTAPTAVGG